MTAGRHLAARLVLLLAATLAALLVAEGACSLLTGHGLLRWIVGPPAVLDAAPPTDAERRRAAANNPGPYAVHRDPLVGYVLRGDSRLELFGGAVHSDALGLRRRTGPHHDVKPLRVAVVGDSVAFGYGLDDDQVLAQRLEDLLSAVQPADAPPVECRTVAVPGWNCRNAVAFLLDHWTDLLPDIVIYLPIHNDLLDTDGVLETGHRRPAPDISTADPWLSVEGTASWPFVRALVGDDVAALSALRDVTGPNALLADLTPESQRRYDDNARLLSLLSRYLRARDAKLLFVAYEPSSYLWHLQRRLLAAGTAAPVLPIFSAIESDMKLPDDPHPNAQTVEAMAAWIADDLLERGWVPKRPDAALPGVPERFDHVHAPPRSDEEIVALADAASEESRKALRSVADFTTGEGLAQVYGNLNDDGTVGTRLMLVLARTGTTLDLELAPVPERLDLTPLPVSVEVDGQQVGAAVVPREATFHERYELPASDDPLAPVEVRLIPYRWVALPIRGLTQLVSFKPLRIAVTD